MTTFPPAIKELLTPLPVSLPRNEQTLGLAGDRPVYIYGAGNVGKDLFRILRGRDIPVEAFFDRKAEANSSWEGIPILQPDDPTISAARREQSEVVIGIFNRDTEMPPITALLKKLGYGRVTSFLEAHHRFSAELGDRFWLGPRFPYLEWAEPIAAAHQIWSDEASRTLYEAILKFRLTLDYGVLPAPSLADQYFPTGLPAWPSPLRFIDCGAYDGDTIRDLLDAHRETEVQSIAAFEPDPNNFAQLAQTMRSRAERVQETVSLFPCGVSTQIGPIRFSAGRGEASRASKDGETTIQCVALDEALPGFRPNLIKMDIEGGEYAALLGARSMIEEFRPRLAICLYHQPEHLWSIPLLAASWLQGGRHYLRSHAYNGFELVYYWVP